MIKSRRKAGLLLGLMFCSSPLWAQTNPHDTLTFDCQACHETEQWQRLHFDHNKTDFKLNGQHKQLPCVSCHRLNNFADVPLSCNGCHTDVHHGRLYPQCERCHSTQNWIILDPEQAHANTIMPLTGRHAALDCWSCHRGVQEGEWRRVRSNCYDCHRQEYLSAQEPLHTDLEFGPLCEDCHSQLAWIPAVFKKHEREYFPVYSGAHAGEWSSCATCHQDGGNYAVFSCFINCHEHGRSVTDGRHREVAGYRYDSQACFNCHRNGRGDD